MRLKFDESNRKVGGSLPGCNYKTHPTSPLITATYPNIPILQHDSPQIRHSRCLHINTLFRQPASSSLSPRRRLNRSNAEPEANPRTGIQSIGEYLRPPSTREKQAHHRHLYHRLRTPLRRPSHHWRSFLVPEPFSRPRGWRWRHHTHNEVRRHPHLRPESGDQIRRCADCAQYAHPRWAVYLEGVG